MFEMVPDSSVRETKQLECPQPFLFFDSKHHLETMILQSRGLNFGEDKSEKNIQRAVTHFNLDWCSLKMGSQSRTFLIRDMTARLFALQRILENPEIIFDGVF